MKCEHCGQEMPRIHKETLSEHKLMMLKDAASYILDRDKNDFDLHSRIGDTNFYNNFQKLRYHGLIFNIGRGHWGITRNGWAFLRGTLELPKWVKISGNHITERSGRLIGVRDVYYGSREIQTSFEYFDEFGHKVGVMPSPVRELQTSLIDW